MTNYVITSCAESSPNIVIYLSYLYYISILLIYQELI